ncbi:MAG: L,D-transpeptidase, partial [Deltaproteobacteria bacterium]|nr:L,D-transpeptidase [Deltaproteobacteria bacterium]
MKIKKAFCLYRAKSEILLLTLISFLIIHFIIPASTSQAKQLKGKPKLVPATLLKWPEGGSDYVILVDKSIQKVFVYKRNHLFVPVKVYRCSTGENNGPKSRQNDRKTPEGIYFFTNSYVKKELSLIYGSRAFPLDYPNPIDGKEGREGYGIWFHGTNKLLKPNDTNGCIVLEDHDIDELASYIKLNDTPVIISSKIEMVRPETLRKKRIELEKIIEGWRSAWEKKEIDRYMSFYSRRFTSGGRNWQQWKKYKTRLAKKYKRIRVETDNLYLLRNDGIALAKFDQSYSAAGFESIGEKRLYLTQNSNQWKVMGEFFKEDAGKRLAAAKRPSLSSVKDIKDFIYLWKMAWEKGDLKTYISCYDQKFRSRGMGLKAWKRHKEKLNRKYRDFKIDIRDLKIAQVSNHIANVSFKQNYRANGYSDFGLKKIYLIRKGNHWKIKK